MVKNKSWRALAVGIVLVLSLNACIVNRFRVGTLRTDSETVELDDAESVRADIHMSFGELDIRGGSSDLLEAEFTYNIDELEPYVDYDISGSTGRLMVEHRDTEGLPVGEYDDVRSEWMLSFNDDIPIDLTLTVGAVKGDIDLRGVALTSLEIDVGAGGGDIWLGGSPLQSLDINMGAGDFTLDMTAGWERDLSADIRGGVGKVTIYLPTDVGVRVDVEMGLAAVDTEGLDKNGNTYTNSAFGESDISLRIDIEGGLGDIRLIVR